MAALCALCFLLFKKSCGIIKQFKRAMRTARMAQDGFPIREIRECDLRCGYCVFAPWCPCVKREIQRACARAQFGQPQPNFTTKDAKATKC